jgi:hypothetical protein
MGTACKVRVCEEQEQILIFNVTLDGETFAEAIEEECARWTFDNRARFSQSERVVHDMQCFAAMLLQFAIRHNAPEPVYVGDIESDIEIVVYLDDNQICVR